MRTWDFDNNTSGKKAEFTKFPTGITKIRVLDDAPHVRWSHWMPKHSRGINCPGRECPICEIRKRQKTNGESYSYGMSRRFSMNVLNRETGKIEIMEQGVTFFQDLKDLTEELAEEGKTLLDVDLKVKRRGTGKDDTSYRIDIDEKYELTEEEKKRMEEEVIDLNEFFKPNTPEQINRLLDGESWDEVMKSQNQEQEQENNQEVDVQIN